MFTGRGGADHNIQLRMSQIVRIDRWMKAVAELFVDWLKNRHVIHSLYKLPAQYACIVSCAVIVASDTMDSAFLIINSELHLPHSELQYRFARSGGPGGQHVNKTETQVELLFDVAHSPSLTATQRQRLLTKLKNDIDQEGVLHLTSQSERSQLRNREAVTARFQETLAAALR